MIQSHIRSTQECEVVLKIERLSHLSGPIIGGFRVNVVHGRPSFQGIWNDTISHRFYTKVWCGMILKFERFSYLFGLSYVI